VTTAVLRTALSDCASDNPGKCDTVAETDTTLYLDVPAEQVRRTDESVYFSSGSKITGAMQWSYNVTEVSAK
jgi:hypothetical protein